MGKIVGYNNSYDAAALFYNYYASLGVNNSNVFVKSVNDLKWYWFSYNISDGQVYCYFTNKNSDVYMLEYTVFDTVDKVCSTSKSKIVNSIKFK